MHNWFHGSRSYFGNFYASRTKFGSPSQLLSFGGFACNLNWGSIAEVRDRKSSSIHCWKKRKVFVGLPRKIISKVEATRKKWDFDGKQNKTSTTTDWSRQKQAVCGVRRTEIFVLLFSIFAPILKLIVQKNTSAFEIGRRYFLITKTATKTTDQSCRSMTS